MCKKTTVFTVLTLLILVLLTVFGSIWDYEISSAVYIGEMPSENIFGVIFAFIGIAPTFLGWAFLGAAILFLTKKQIKKASKRRLLIALSVFLFILSFFYFCNTVMLVNSNAFSVHWGIAYPIGIAVILGASYLGFKMAQKSKNENLLEALCLLAFVSIFTMLIIMSTKEIMDRPRYRWVLSSENPDYFRSFWQSGGALKSTFGSALSDDFASFPSGHSAYSMFAIFLFPSAIDFFPRLEKYRTHLFFLGFLWWGATALSRITVGAHYLTDVSIAAIVTIISYVSVHIIKKAFNKKPQGSEESL